MQTSIKYVLLFAVLSLATVCLWTSLAQGILHAQADATAPPDVAKLVIAANAGTVEARMAAVDKLLALGPAAAPAVGPLIELLKGSDGIYEATTPQSGDRVFFYNPVQTLAMQALVAIGAPAVEPMRAALATADPQELQMSYLTAALVKTGEPIGLSTVQELLLRGPTPMARRRAADALAYSKDPGSFDALVAALSDADPAVRQDAVYALEKISDGRQYGQDAARWKAWKEVWLKP